MESALGQPDAAAVAWDGFGSAYYGWLDSSAELRISRYVSAGLWDSVSTLIAQNVLSMTGVSDGYGANFVWLAGAGSLLTVPLLQKWPKP